MHIATKRFELEIHRDSLYLRASAFGKMCATFLDWSGSGLSATDWMIADPARGLASAGEH